jgi:hypothetical protein
MVLLRLYELTPASDRLHRLGKLTEPGIRGLDKYQLLRNAPTADPALAAHPRLKAMAVRTGKLLDSNLFRPVLVPPWNSNLTSKVRFWATAGVECQLPA